MRETLNLQLDESEARTLLATLEWSYELLKIAGQGSSQKLDNHLQMMSLASLKQKIGLEASAQLGVESPR